MPKSDPMSRDIFGVQLSHLRVFMAVYEERSVRRAANRLGLTPSAISHSLARLRASVGDELFLRKPEGMVPTARADEIAVDLRRALDQLHGLLQPARFDPAESTRHFTVAAMPYMCRLLGPILAGLVKDEAPGITIDLRLLDETVVDQIERGQVDVAVIPIQSVPRGLAGEPLNTEILSVALRKGHPRGEGPISLAELETLPMIDIKMGAIRASEVIAPGDPAGRAPAEFRQRFVMTVPDALTALDVVAETDFAALVTGRAAGDYIRANRIVLLAPPHRPPAQAMHLAWNPRYERDGAHAWLRAAIRRGLGG